MQEKLKEKNKEKAKFYFSEKLKAHIELIPTGFKNVIFDSELINDTFYWVIDLRDLDQENPKKIRLFLAEIHDIDDYQEEDKDVS